MYKCKCSLNFKNKGALKIHQKYCNLTENDVNKIRECYLIDLLSITDLLGKYKDIVGKAIILKILEDVLRTQSESAKIAHRLKPEAFKHSDESKEKMRKSRLKYMKANPEKTAWRQANLSYPEKLFKNKMEELGMNEKYLIVREYSIFPYFIDFAFANEKIAIEIDGSQHELPERKKKDNEKDRLLNNIGWEVIRIPASNVIYDIDNLFNDLLEKFNCNKVYANVGIIKYVEYKRECLMNHCKCGNVITKKSKRCKLCDSIYQRKVDRPSYKQLLKEIEETNYCEVGRKYGVCDNSIRKWIKQYEKVK